MEPKLLVVWVTVPKERAEELAREWVASRRAACANVLDGVQSAFWWNGKVDIESEALVVLKTVPDGFEALASAIEESHPYDVPEIAALPVVHVNDAYADWVRAEVRSEP